MARKLTEHGTIRHDDYMAEVMRDHGEAVAYLNACLEEPDPRMFLLAVRHVVDANGGIATAARKTGLNRENLYRMLSLTGNPRLESLYAILKGLGFRLSVEVAPGKSRRSKPRRKSAA